MEQYLEVLAFSIDLVVYVGKKIDVPTEDFPCWRKRLTDVSRFNNAIGRAIWGFSKTSNIIRQISQEKMMGFDGDTVVLFGKYAMQAAAEYFPKGYGHREFFAYCAAVIGAAVYLYKKKKDVRVVDEMVFEKVAGVIGTVLNKQVLVSGFDCSDKAWQEMTEYAKKFNASRGFEED